MKKLLWVGDAGVPSGFAQATHNILETLRYQLDVTVLGINYRGDPHPYPYPIYAAAPGGDAFGVGRLIWMCDLVKPDVIVFQNDPWNITPYVSLLQHFDEYKDVPLIGAIAIDGKHCKGKVFNDLALTIFWTEFAREEARLTGHTAPSAVIPLGVDRNIYYPVDKLEARARRLKAGYEQAFIVGNVNRNQPRKRLDLTIRYFAEWVRQFKVEDAYLYLHVAPTGDTGVQVADLAHYYGVRNKLLLMEPATFYGISEGEMRDTYNCFDVQVTTTQGEGFGLTTFEGMACGVPQVVPEWSALGELTKDAVWQVKCTSTAVGPPYLNVIGGVADEGLFIQALQALYSVPHYRARNSAAALERASQPRFNWSVIGERWQEAVDGVLAGKVEEVTA